MDIVLVGKQERVAGVHSSRIRYGYRSRPDHYRRMRDRTLFDLAINDKVRGRDGVKIRIGDIVAGAVGWSISARRAWLERVAAKIGSSTRGS